MKLIRNAFISGVFMLALAAGALAQEKAKQSGEPGMPVAGKSTIGVSVAEAQLITPGLRASKMVGSEVRNEADEKVGKIDDLIVTPDGRLSVAIVDVGGFLGVGKHKVAIPVRQFKRLGAGKALLPAATKDELKKLPEFEYTQ